MNTDPKSVSGDGVVGAENAVVDATETLGDLPATSCIYAWQDEADESTEGESVDSNDRTGRSVLAVAALAAVAPAPGFVA